ncbi:hypothetical protein CCP3SC1_510024 [Gammaproteobacteria bacterium]
MVGGVSMPLNDSEVERHKFYMALTKEMECSSLVLNSEVDKFEIAFQKIDDRLIHLKQIMDDVVSKQSSTETRNKTLIASITIVWILFSAVFSWVWEKTTTKAELLIDRIAAIEDEIKTNRNTNATLQSEINSIKSIKGQVMTIQSDMESLMQKGKQP